MNKYMFCSGSGRMNPYRKGIHRFYPNWMDYRRNDLLRSRSLWFKSRMVSCAQEKNKRLI
jgi:hypothetical protein